MMMRKGKLFMLPYAGGSASVYLSWKKHLPAEVELIPMELPGRGKRYKEPLIDSVQNMIPVLLEDITSHELSTSYAIFGHSMGNLLALELARELAKQDHPLPAALFLSGRNPPHVKSNFLRHVLSEQELVQEILKLGGTPPELMENREWLELFLPIIRSDYKLVETYQFKWDAPLDCPFMIFNGKQDLLIDAGQIEEWSRFTSREYSAAWFEGDHFYIHDQAEEICRQMVRHLGTPTSPLH
ncbi:thioesterase II family protein [Brevibacillus borstelensis]|uniref:thioesterase II family protein n=1 Tax=Brevibacillus borstelensis TaxID=45462 RepID=UPI001EEFD0D5|nr:thioesterase domain-containing protein [Brevibacillus borstelensis]MED1883486.1 thioesterase domain-containing protein [Brevibacillus borstelensis]